MHFSRYDRLQSIGWLPIHCCVWCPLQREEADYPLWDIGHCRIRVSKNPAFSQAAL